MTTGQKTLVKAATVAEVREAMRRCHRVFVYVPFLRTHVKVREEDFGRALKLAPDDYLVPFYEEHGEDGSPLALRVG